jgi:hypothetical protein
MSNSKAQNFTIETLLPSELMATNTFQCGVLDKNMRLYLFGVEPQSFLQFEF